MNSINPAILVAIIGAVATLATAILNPQFISTILSLASGRRPQPPARSQRVVGCVRNNATDERLPSARVSLEADGEIPSFDLTDELGVFNFPSQSFSNTIVRLRVEATGYKTFVQLIDLSKNTATIDIRLSPISGK